MESSLRESLNQIRTRKEDIQNHQLVSLQCNNQFNEMNIPFRMSTEQHLQPLSWIAKSENQHIVLPEDSNLYIDTRVYSPPLNLGYLFVTALYLTISQRCGGIYKFIFWELCQLSWL